MHLDHKLRPRLHRARRNWKRWIHSENASNVICANFVGGILKCNDYKKFGICARGKLGQGMESSWCYCFRKLIQSTLLLSTGLKGTSRKKTQEKRKKRLRFLSLHGEAILLRGVRKLINLIKGCSITFLLATYLCGFLIPSKGDMYKDRFFRLALCPFLNYFHTRILAPREVDGQKIS